METPSYGLLRLLELSVVRGKNDTVDTSKKVEGLRVSKEIPAKDNGG